MPKAHIQENLLLFCAHICLLAFGISIGTPSKANYHNQKTIKFWAIANSVEDISLYKELASDFQSKHGIKVDITPLGWGDYAQKYFTAMAAGVAPDVGVAGQTSPMEWGSVGKLVAFDEQFPGDLIHLQEELLPGLLDQFRFQGHLYGLPTDIVTPLVYYRPKMLRKWGLKPPKTWSELEHTIRRIEQNNFRFYLGWTKSEQWALSYYFAPFGFEGPKFNTEKPELDWRNKSYQEAILFALRLWYFHGELGLLTPERQVSRFLSNTPAESIPMMVDGNWLAPIISEAASKLGIDWDVFPWPKADLGQPNNLMGGTSYVIFQDSKNKKEAMNWLNHLLSLSVQQKILLHRIGRKDQTATLNISPLKFMWTEANDPFWAQQEFKNYQNVIKSLKQVAWTFKSFPKPLGLKDANHLEDQLLDRMRTFILGRLEQQANLHLMSIWEYLRSVAQGKFKNEMLAIKQMSRRKLSQEYDHIYPTALSRMQKEGDSYRNDFSQNIENKKQQKMPLNILHFFEAIFIFATIFCLFFVSLRKNIRAYITSYFMILPPILLTSFFVVIPMCTAFYLSLTEYNAILPLESAKWVGLKHYANILMGNFAEKIGDSLEKTAVFAGTATPLTVFLSFIMALLLNSRLIFPKFWRFLFFTPLITSSVATALVFTQIYSESESGWLNHLLIKSGVIKNPSLLLKDEDLFLWCVMGLNVWQSLSFNILILMSGLKQIPLNLYKAADIDGAGYIRKIWHVVIPSLKPQIMFITLIGMISSIQVFEPIYMMGGGSGYVGSKFGPNNSGLTIAPLIFDLGFERFKMGQASAIAYILFLITFFISLAKMKLVDKNSVEHL